MEQAAAPSMSVDELRRLMRQAPTEKSKVFAYIIERSIVVAHDIIEKQLRTWETESLTKKMRRLLIFDTLRVKNACMVTEEIETALPECETSLGNDPMSALEGPELAAYYLGKGKGQSAVAKAAAVNNPAPA
ncbi:unnamed protein product, partial [Prorocentrum cordatum]